MWDKARLKETVQTKMEDYLLIVASNRQPYSHLKKGSEVVCQRQPGGLVTALTPVMETVNGIWIGTGTSPYDRQVVDENNKIQLPPENPSFSLKRVFLSKEEMDGFYYGYSNEGMWPLSHIAYERPYFSASDWEQYKKVNKMYADAILEEVGNRKAFVWIQDFHLMMVAKYLRESDNPNIITSLFWHIPWPNEEVFGICPQKNELLESLLAHDLLGFQIQYHCDNFLKAVDASLESRIDREKKAVSFHNHETLVRPFPISIDFQQISDSADEEDIEERMERLREEYGLKGKKMIFGIDRIDYTKGIPDKFKAIDRFIEKRPEYKEKFVFVQLGQVSRIQVPRYKQLNDELNSLVIDINWKHSQGSWMPINFTREYMDYKDILALYRLADVCIVSSLHDGMNLVAKEYVAARSDLDGVLLLSQFTGAARELEDSIIINPYDTESFADSIAQALAMLPEEKEKRMVKMRDIVDKNNIYRWSGRVLSNLLNFEFDEDM